MFWVGMGIYQTTFVVLSFVNISQLPGCMSKRVSKSIVRCIGETRTAWLLEFQLSIDVFTMDVSGEFVIHCIIYETY